MMYPAFWIILTFVFWIFSFHPFLSAKFSLSSDAISYYEHIKFFVENLVQGVFPLWNPFWCSGAPNDFFLRRLGSLNPFYSIIAIFEFLRVPYAMAYVWFMALYFWSGTIAFYLLGMRLYQNRLIAYAGYLMILFSALGTRIFDSYMMLITVPIIWFFYFLIAFSQTPRKQFFLGMCLSFALLSSTYIPFYFLSFFVLFLFCFGIVYFQKISELATRYWGFFKANKVMVVLSIGFVLASFTPLITFYFNSTKGQIVLPLRQLNSDPTKALLVPQQSLDWGILEDLVFSLFHSDLSTYKFAVVYVPFFAFVVFVLGLFCRISRRAVLMFLCGFILFCSIIPHGLPFYDFLYKHVFFLKYFRNLHFFLWFILIPLFILLVLEHWDIFVKQTASFTKKNILIYVILIHWLLFLFVWVKADAISSTYVMLLLSLVFWSMFALSKLKGGLGSWVLLTMIILVQPLEVFHHLCTRPEKFNREFYDYQFSFWKLDLKADKSSGMYSSPQKSQLYYSSNNYNLFYQNIANPVLFKYFQYKFYLTDHVQVIDPKKVDFELLQKSFDEQDNKAFVFKTGQHVLQEHGNDPRPPAYIQPIVQENQSFKILSFDANHVKLSIDLPYDKFLIYNDTYDSNWKLAINGRKSPFYQTNVAFKGVWLKAGKSIVEFRYGQLWQYAMNYVLLIGSFILLLGILWFSFLDWRTKKK